MRLLRALAGCSGPFVHVAPTPPPHAETRDRVHGRACGLLLFDFVPIGVNERTARAYAEETRTARVTSLTDADLTTSWYHVGIGTRFCTGLEGTAVR